ncbi:hypothetical protein FOMPIDRAFT_1050226 [Fomitopsis schrenkii]|uniref:RING-type domain-containing protein n=1 Tax=Fomitopsis schrenkii TaxID=2126942 RepID=S8E440_FOMSC|nr:hypothetical protein FOMPIDRAFT_1050226 [Fomitopsis schrenkii]
MSDAQRAEHPLCDICRGRLFQPHPDTPKVKFSYACGHLYCKECILSFMREHPGSGCPQCALGFTTVQGDVSDNPEHVLGSLYAPMTTQDESDEILEDIVASSPALILGRRRLDLGKTLLANAQQEHDALLAEQQFNTNAAARLLHQLDVASNVYDDAIELNKKLAEELDSMRGDRERLEHELASMQD